MQRGPSSGHLYIADKMNKAVLAIISFALVSLAIVFVLIPIFESWVVQQPVITQFLFYYFLIFLIICAVVWAVIHNGLRSFRFASAATLIMMAIDLVLPSYAVDWQGNFAQSQTIGYFGSIDYSVATFWNWIGISGWPLALFTYVITGAIFLYAALYLLGRKIFVAELKRFIV